MVDVLHINDNNLAIESAGTISYSQGYAWLKGDQVVFDLDGSDSPVSHCRLSPQEINNRYWQQCEQSAIPTNGAGMRHAADLIWRHLSQLKQKKNLNDLVLIVPSHYRQSNLQLLLGIAKACQLNVKGLANKAIVALQDQVKENGEYWHFDVQLHQTVCSRVLVRNGLLKLGDIEILNDVGIHLMQEALLKGLQNNFIQNDRFDPLHDAATEQQLFDQLASIATQLAENGKASVDLQHQGRLHNTTLDSKEWQGVLKTFADQLLEMSQSADGSYVDLNAAFGKVGLESLNQAGLVNLNQAPVASLTQLVQAPDSGAVIYRTDLSTQIATPASNDNINDSAKLESIANSARQKATPVTSNNAIRATHVLLAGKAVQIDQARLSTSDGVLGLSQSPDANIEALLTAGKLFILNDESRTQLRVNDRIASHLADGVVTVIQVL